MKANTVNMSKEERVAMVKEDLKMLPVAAGVTAGYVGSHAFFDKTLRADTFMGTVKNCAKHHSQSGRAGLMSFLDFIKLGKLNKYVDKIGNKTFLAGLLAVDVAFNLLLINGLKSFFKSASQNN